MIDKVFVLAELHARLGPAIARVAALDRPYKQKAQLANALVGDERNRLISEIAALPIHERGTAALVIQYCCSVVSLEYRNRVWPYEYMAFSRRVGELWEAFCRTAWTYPTDPMVARMEPPNFEDVRNTLLGRMTHNLGDHGNATQIMSDISTLFEIIGEINMHEDEVFKKDGVPHVIDFKSGFGSNEKGNMLRLIAVGRAYRVWDHRTKLMLLVRQEENNNYLKALLRGQLWEVYTGIDTYEKIESITGADIKSVRSGIINWQEDLSPSFYSYLKSQPTDLTAYLTW